MTHRLTAPPASVPKLTGPPPESIRVTGKAYQGYILGADASTLRSAAEVLRRHGHRTLARMLAGIARRIES